MADNWKTGRQLILSYNSHVIAVTCTEDGGIKATASDFEKNDSKFQTPTQTITWSVPNITLHLVAVKCVEETSTRLHLPCVLLEATKTMQTTSVSCNKKMYILAFLSLDRRKFVPVKRFQSELCLQRVKFLYLIDGPLVCWYWDNAMYYTISNSDGGMKVQKIPLQKPCTFFHSQVFNRQVIAMAAKQTSEIDAMETDDIDMNSKTKVMWGHEWIVFTFDPTGHKGQGDANQYLDGTDFVPHAYANTVSAIHVEKCIKCNIHEPNGCMSPIGTANGDCVFQTLIATVHGQLLQFKAGKLLRHCSLPFSDACKICVAMVPGGSKLVIVKSSSGKCCAIWEKTFQVAEIWEDVGEMFADDFLHCGSDQILMLSNNTPQSEELDKFILTDLQLCNINNMNTSSDDEHDVAMETKDATSSSNLSKVVQALESRLQASVASTRKSELLCAEKDKIIQKTYNSLVQMSTGDETISGSASQSTLVCLYDGMKNAKGTNASQVKRGQEHRSKVMQKERVDVKHVWQRVVDGMWVIGATIENRSDRPLTQLSLSSVCLDDPSSQRCDVVSSSKLLQDSLAPRLQSTPFPGIQLRNTVTEYNLPCKVTDYNLPCKVTDYNLPCKVTEYNLPCKVTEYNLPCKVTEYNLPYKRHTVTDYNLPCKRQKLEDEVSRTMLYPGNQIDVVTMTTLPEFGSDGTCSCSLVLKWKENTDVDSTLSMFDRSKGIERIQCIGSAILTVNDVTNGKLTVEYNKLPEMSDKELTIAMKALDAMQLTTHLQIKSKHTNLLCLTQVLQDIIGFQKLPGNIGYVICHGELNGVRIQVQTLEYNKAVVTLCTKSERQLILTVHTLYEGLPDDVYIGVHISATQVNHALTDSLETIKCEIEETMEGCKNLIQAAEKKAIRLSDESQQVKHDDLNEEDKESELLSVRQRFETEKSVLRNIPTSLVDGKEYVILMSGIYDLKLRTDEKLHKLSLLKN